MVTLCIMQVSAAVVLPVGLKPYCSITEEVGVNGLSHLDTTNFYNPGKDGCYRNGVKV